MAMCFLFLCCLCQQVNHSIHAGCCLLELPYLPTLRTCLYPVCAWNCTQPVQMLDGLRSESGGWNTPRMRFWTESHFPDTDKFCRDAKSLCRVLYLFFRLLFFSMAFCSCSDRAFLILCVFSNQILWIFHCIISSWILIGIPQ